MSLVVSVFQITDDGKSTLVDLPSTAGEDPELAGPEVWRHLVWGGTLVRQLGCRLLPTLETGNLWADPESIPVLLDDLDRIRQNVGQVATAAKAEPSHVLFHLDNIERAAKIAMNIPNRRGQVVIW